MKQSRRAEAPVLAWSFACFFFLLASWYVVRPIREAMGISGGAGNLAWLMLVTVGVTLLINPLYAALLARYERDHVVRIVYRFLALNLVAFYVLLVWVPRWYGEFSEPVRLRIGYVLFVWVTAFALLIVSLLWSLLAEVFPAEAARRRFGVVAAGCSLGALVGSTLIIALVDRLEEPLSFLLLAALLLELAARCTRRIVAAAPWPRSRPTEPLGGSAWEGFRLALRSPYLLTIIAWLQLYTLTGTWVYLLQGGVVEAESSEFTQQVQRFAQINWITSLVSFLVQALAVGAVVRRLGPGLTLCLLPLVCVAGFAWVWVAPSLVAIIVFQTVRRVVNYGLAKPAREMLFNVVPTAEQYKAKNLVDVGLYRAGDALGGLSFGAIAWAGGALAAVAVPAAAVWTLLGLPLARMYRERAPADD